MNPAIPRAKSTLLTVALACRTKTSRRKGEKMKLLRYGSLGHEKPGLLAADGEMRDLSAIIPDLAGEALLPESIEKLGNADISRLPIVRGRPRIGPCVGSVGKFVCIGLNYSDHAADAGMAMPAEPVIFMKATSSICGPN